MHAGVSCARQASFKPSRMQICISIHALIVCILFQVARISVPQSICCSSCSMSSKANAATAPETSPYGYAGPFQTESALCGQCVGIINRYITQRELPKNYIAFCMGGHPRLGLGSLVGTLDTSLLPVILGFCWPNSAVPLE